jgi:flagellar biosynthetic protein FlhB
VSSDKASKTEKPTPKKIKDSRKKGQVGKSPEVSAWLTTFAMTLLLPWTFNRARDLLYGISTQMSHLIENPDEGLALALWGSGMRGALIAILPMALGLMTLGVLANLLQVGVVLSPQALKPKFKQLNPLPGIKRMFGAKTAWNACKEVIKLFVLGGMAYYSLSGFIPLLVNPGGLELMTVLDGVGSAAMSFLRNAAMLGLLLAAADYAMQKRQHLKELKMSKQDIKDEYKQADGDPQMKGMIRQRQMSMSRNRMMSDIATADVVLVNPTHVAVALRYDPLGGAPKVVAKGSGVIAAKIRERAEEHRVPMVRDVPLARALHKACEIGEEIPAEMYGAVAQVLAFIFSLKARGAAAGTHTVRPAALAVG